MLLERDLSRENTETGVAVAWVDPSTLRRSPSSIASRSADCVLGDARLSSSAKDHRCKDGAPDETSGHLGSVGLKTKPPTMSAGSRSGREPHPLERQALEPQANPTREALVFADARHVLKQDVAARQDRRDT